MKIGNIEFPDRPLFLAPMEDVTDIGFRRLCKQQGAQMVYTEFVAAEALVRSVRSTVDKLTIADDERPVGIQIYGRDVDAVVEAGVGRCVDEGRAADAVEVVDNQHCLVAVAFLRHTDAHGLGREAFATVVEG